jgi:hypothetical protein
LKDDFHLTFVYLVFGHPFKGWVNTGHRLYIISRQEKSLKIDLPNFTYDLIKATSLAQVSCLFSGNYWIQKYRNISTAYLNKIPSYTALFLFCPLAKRQNDYCSYGLNKKVSILSFASRLK